MRRTDKISTFLTISCVILCSAIKICILVSGALLSGFKSRHLTKTNWYRYLPITHFRQRWHIQRTNITLKPASKILWKTSVSYSYRFQCGSGSSSLGQCGSGSKSRILMTKNCKKIYNWKRFIVFIIKNCNLLIPRPPYRTFKLKEKPSSP